jgi:hypothetical protein
MLVLSNRVPENNAHSPSYVRFTEMMDRRLSIARIGLAEARRHMEAGQSEDADIVLEKIDEDLHLLRRRLSREAETVAPRSSMLHGCTN